MNEFTCRESGDKPSCQSVFLKLDSKGRISIPSFLRKNFGIERGSVLLLQCDLNVNFIVLIPKGNLTTFNKSKLYINKSGRDSNGQDSVIGNTRGCGPLNLSSKPDPFLSRKKGLRLTPKKGIFKSDGVNENLSPGPGRIMDEPQLDYKDVLGESVSCIINKYMKRRE